MKKVWGLVMALFVSSIAVPAQAQDPLAEAAELVRQDDEEAAKAVLDQACKAGTMEACWRLALIHSHNSYVDDGAAAAKQFLANCAKGDARSCYMVSYRKGYSNDEKEQAALEARAKVALGKACDGGLGFACLEQAQTVRYAPGSAEPDRALLLKLFIRACNEGYGKGCSEAMDIYSQDYENPLFDPKKALDLAIKACDLGEGSGCAALVHLEDLAREEPNVTLAEHQRAQALLLKACKLGNSESCASMLTRAADYGMAP